MLVLFRHDFNRLTVAQVFASAKSVLERTVCRCFVAPLLFAQSLQYHIVTLISSCGVCFCVVRTFAATQPTSSSRSIAAQQYGQHVMRSRFLLVDRVAAELPHMSRSEIEEHEDW